MIGPSQTNPNSPQRLDSSGDGQDLSGASVQTGPSLEALAARLIEKLHLKVGDSVELGDITLLFDSDTGMLRAGMPMPVTQINRHGRALDVDTNVEGSPKLSQVLCDVTRLERSLYRYHFIFRSYGIDHKFTSTRYWNGKALLTGEENARHELETIYALPIYGVFKPVTHGMRFMDTSSGSLVSGTPMPNDIKLPRTMNLHLGGHFKEPRWKICRLTSSIIVHEFDVRDKRAPKNAPQARLTQWFIFDSDSLHRLGKLDLSNLRDTAWHRAFEEMDIGHRRIIPINHCGYVAKDDGQLTQVMYYTPRGEADPQVALDKYKLPENAYTCTCAVSRLGARKFRVDQRWVNQAGEYVAHTALLKEGDTWSNVEKERKHAFKISEAKGKILGHIVAGIYERIYGPFRVQASRPFELNPISMEVRRVGCFIDGKLLAQSKWGPSAQDIANTALRLVRLRRSCHLNTPAPEIVVYKTEEMERINAAMTHARIGPEDLRLISLEDLMERAKVPQADRDRYLRILGEVDDMADSRDLMGLSAMRSQIRNEIRFHRRKLTKEDKNVPKEIVVPEESTWQGRLMRFVVDHPEQALAEIKRLREHHFGGWETEYQTNIAVVASYLLDKIAQGRDGSPDGLSGPLAQEMELELLTLVPILREDHYHSELWRTIVAYRKAVRLYRQKCREEDLDLLSLVQLDRAKDPHRASLSVGAFSMTERAERIEASLPILANRLGIFEVEIQDTWSRQKVGFVLDAAAAKAASDAGGASNGTHRSGRSHIVEIRAAEPPAIRQVSAAQVLFKGANVDSENPMRTMRRAAQELAKIPAKEVAKEPHKERESFYAILTTGIIRYCCAKPEIWREIRWFEGIKGEHSDPKLGEFEALLDRLGNKLLKLDRAVWTKDLASELRKARVHLGLEISPAARSGDQHRFSKPIQRTRHRRL